MRTSALPFDTYKIYTETMYKTQIIPYSRISRQVMKIHVESK